MGKQKGRQTKALAESPSALLEKASRPLDISDLLLTYPSLYMRFCMYDHEETALFGIMRDEMIRRRRGETQAVWQARCEAAQWWNRQRAHSMYVIRISRMREKFGGDALGVLDMMQGMIENVWTLQLQEVQQVPQLEAGGRDERHGREAHPQTG